jgi:hypothetical protein
MDQDKPKTPPKPAPALTPDERYKKLLSNPRFTEMPKLGQGYAIGGEMTSAMRKAASKAK